MLQSKHSHYEREERNTARVDKTQCHNHLTLQFFVWPLELMIASSTLPTALSSIVPAKALWLSHIWFFSWAESTWSLQISSVRCPIFLASQHPFLSITVWVLPSLPHIQPQAPRYILPDLSSFWNVGIHFRDSIILMFALPFFKTNTMRAKKPGSLRCSRYSLWPVRLFRGKGTYRQTW